MIVAGASAYTRIIDFAKFRKICDSVGASLMVDMAHIAGLIAAGKHPSPIPHADIITSTTHKTLRGPRGGLILAKKGLGRNVNSAVFPNAQGGPLVHTIAAKAVALKEASTPVFQRYQKQVLDNAKALAAVLSDGGLRIVSGGTDTHMVLVDLTTMNMSGKEAEESLGRSNIVVNRNAIPFDQKPPREASGIRLGTSCISTRGMNTDSTEELGELILRVLRDAGNSSVEAQVTLSLIHI